MTVVGVICVYFQISFILALPLYTHVITKYLPSWNKETGKQKEIEMKEKGIIISTVFAISHI